MPTYRITLKYSGNCNTIQYEKGLFVDVITLTTTNPVTVNGGTKVQDAFMLKYGLDVKKAGQLNSGAMEVKQI